MKWASDGAQLSPPSEEVATATVPGVAPSGERQETRERVTKEAGTCGGAGEVWGRSNAGGVSLMQRRAFHRKVCCQSSVWWSGRATARRHWWPLTGVSCWNWAVWIPLVTTARWQTRYVIRGIVAVLISKSKLLAWF